MNASRLQLFLIPLFLSSVGTLGGWAITDKLAGEQAGKEFVMFGLSINIITAAIQLALVHLAKTRLPFLLLYGATALFSMAWIMAALALPLFWIFANNAFVQTTLAAFFMTVLLYGIYRSSNDFTELWASVDKESISQSIVSCGGAFHPDELRQYGKLTVSFLPKSLIKYEDFLQGVIGAAMLISLIAGLNLRKLFPIPSAFAWGIPALYIYAYLLCLGVMGVFLSIEYFRLEMKLGIHIRPMSNEEARKRKIALRREKRQKRKK